MNIFRRVREAAERFAEAVQERGRQIMERARDIFSRETYNKEETMQEPAPDFPYNPPEYEQSLSEKMKEEDLKKKEEQHRKAYESFNKDYMGDTPISRYEYDIMWDTIGEYTNDSESLGSPDMIEIYDAMTEKYGYDIDKEFVKEFIDHAMQSAPDAMYKEDYINAIYDAIKEVGSVEEFYDSLGDEKS